MRRLLPVTKTFVIQYNLQYSMIPREERIEKATKLKMPIQEDAGLKAFKGL